MGAHSLVAAALGELFYITLSPASLTWRGAFKQALSTCFCASHSSPQKQLAHRLGLGTQAVATQVSLTKPREGQDAKLRGEAAQQCSQSPVGRGHCSGTGSNLLVSRATPVLTPVLPPVDPVSSSLWPLLNLPCGNLLISTCLSLKQSALLGGCVAHSPGLVGCVSMSCCGEGTHVCTFPSHCPVQLRAVGFRVHSSVHCCHSC